jgi:hypothetical protein
MRGEPVAIERGPGHCENDGFWAEFCARYGPMRREELCLGDRTDFALANDQFLADRYSLALGALQTAAKDRIRWLSVQLAMAIQGRAEMLEALKETRRLVGDAATSGFVDEAAITALFVNNGSITRAIAKATRQ